MTEPMTTVWVLSLFNPEESLTLGVYSSETKAHEAQREWLTRNTLRPNHSLALESFSLDDKAIQLIGGQPGHV